MSGVSFRWPSRPSPVRDVGAIGLLGFRAMEDPWRDERAMRARLGD